MGRQGLQRWCIGLAAAAVAASLILPALGQQRPGGGNRQGRNGGPRRSNNVVGVSDAEVVDSMKKGIEFLLSQKKGDTWEHGKRWNGETPNTGGETAIILYALIHAGQSLQDDPDMNSRLKWNSKELLPAVEWLSKNKPDGTYTAGLQACALALTLKKKDEVPTEGTRLGLELAKKYLIDAMGTEGGYTYIIPKDKPTTAAEQLHAKDPEYWRAKLAAALDNLKTGAMKESDRKDAKGNPIMVPKSHDELQRDVDEMKRNQLSAEQAAGKDFAPIGDLSNAQYGTLGAWALMDYGIEMPTIYWRTSDRFWRMTQHANGSWPYKPMENGERDTMGIAGIASLFITSDFTDTGPPRLTPKVDKNLDNGMAWLNKSFHADTQDFYYLYGVERIGLASGYKFFGTTNWYKEGAANIVKRQGGNGSWQGGFIGAEPTIATSYALLFLARGRNPVVFNKLDYGGNWNARPRDNANVTNYMAKLYEKPINWQVVNLQVEPEEWMDAPVLLITGSTDPNFTTSDLAKIRTFIEAGGMVFSTADGGKSDFTDAMKKYATKVVDGKFEMRALPATHPLFTGELGNEPMKSTPPMMGMSNGVRDLWIHATTDLGAAWQTRGYSSKESFSIPEGVFFYATGKGTLRSKLAPLTVVASKEGTTRTINLALIDHVGNANPEPGAWRRMIKLAQADFKTELKVTTVKWSELDPKKYKIAAMTGSTRFTLNDTDTIALKAFLDGGGMLFADSSGGSADFADSFQSLMRSVYPSTLPQPMGSDHPIILGSMPDGDSAVEVEFRKYGNIKLGRRVTEPKLDVYKVGDRVAVVFSPYDITSGFLGTSTWGVIGYAPDSVQTLARNILLFSQDQKAK